MCLIFYPLFFHFPIMIFNFLKLKKIHFKNFLRPTSLGNGALWNAYYFG
jgi:hypothetical protein